jgi:hypothetical protein
MRCIASNFEMLIEAEALAPGMKTSSCDAA